jgi:NAD-dependent deacetylase
MIKKIAIFTGAGVSAESGIDVFRGKDEALWENHSVEEVATLSGWKKDPQLVTDFYNARRVQLSTVEPNDAHMALARLEQKYEVNLITQNIDDLHERGGSTMIHKLHGDITKVRSDVYPDDIYDSGYDEVDLEEDRGKNNSKLRPHVVWFGEWPDAKAVRDGYDAIADCDILIIVGTSFNITYTWDMVSMVSPDAEVFYVDPEPFPIDTQLGVNNVEFIKEKAVKGVTELVNKLMNR